MKTHKEREGGDAEGDQSMTMADVEQSYKKKEKKMKKKKKNLPLMACNSEVEEDGNEEAAKDANEEMEEGEKLKKKVKTDDVMMSDEKERKEEKKKKKKEKRERMMLSDDKETTVEEKKELISDVEVERSELRSDENVKADGEGGKGEKEKKRKRKEKERNGDKTVDKEQNTPKEKKKELIGDAEVERSKLRSDDDVKADGEGDKVEKEKKRKRKEKERNGDKTVHEEQNTPNDTKEKKKRKRDQMMDDKETTVDAVVSGNGREVEQNKLRDDMKADDEGNKGEKKKKRKEKETKGDVVLHEEPSTGNDKKENKKEKVNGVKGGKADNKEKRRRKGKETKDDMVSGHKELNKGKEKNKEMEAGEAENPEEQRDEMQKSKKRASVADSSENVIPKRRSKRVKFSDEVTVFPPPNNSDKGKKVSKKLKFLDDADALEELQGKKFTKEEDELIIKAVHDYIEAKQLGEEGVNMVMHCNAHGLRGCWSEIRKALPWRFREAIYNRAHSLLERGDDVGNWTKEQVDFVIESHRKHGATWRELSEEMGKYRIHVKDTYRRYKLANRNKGHWSQEEYQTLFDLVNKDLQMKVHAERRSKHGMLRDDISWEAISDTLGTRNQATCLQKWYSQLSSPMVAKGEWADIDDYMLLMELVELDPSCEEEVDWDSLLEHRSGAVCHKRWMQMTNHLGEHGIKSFSEQVEVLSNRYCPYLLETKQQLDARPYVDL